MFPVRSFAQADYCPNGDCRAAYMAELGYYYASEACLSANITCNVHFYLHGCGGSAELWGSTGEAEGTGYMQLADTAR